VSRIDVASASKPGEIGDDARPGRRHPGHGLEVRVDGARELRVAREHVWQGDDRGDQEPGERDDEESLPDADGLLAVRDQPDPDSERRCDRARSQERPGRLGVAER
jgi:hypothetical protein